MNDTETFEQFIGHREPELSRTYDRYHKDMTEGYYRVGQRYRLIHTGMKPAGTLVRMSSITTENRYGFDVTLYQFDEIKEDGTLVNTNSNGMRVYSMTEWIDQDDTRLAEIDDFHKIIYQKNEWYMHIYNVLANEKDYFDLHLKS